MNKIVTSGNPIRIFFLQEKKPLIQPQTFGPTLSENDLRFASWLVSSRAITILTMSDDKEEDEDETETEEMEDDDEDDFGVLATTCVMVPLLDMINHSSDNPNAYFAVFGDDGDENDDEKEENLFYTVVADRDLKRGEELLISYGSEQDSSVDLLLQYGFVPEDNPFDVEFWEEFVEEIGNEETSFWTTTLQHDEDRLSKLGNDSDKTIDRTILEFRIRMKRA
eukprot:CAMPEP_0116150778 /NCGR_PEP_ID=MMETSP0329-20121206/19739_1 /TAXON_ID=697910 /ORGANISM="Pseudo-nitzschia arenysensis, Strain B593" /LENGTH=222 /DNA_ID=CAMNT_0003647335 /DNA_START=53 /DNA_END=718 /DNA_ORIENTATION=+